MLTVDCSHWLKTYTEVVSKFLRDLTGCFQPYTFFSCFTPVCIQYLPLLAMFLYSWPDPQVFLNVPISQFENACSEGILTIHEIYKKINKSVITGGNILAVPPVSSSKSLYNTVKKKKKHPNQNPNRQDTAVSYFTLVRWKEHLSAAYKTEENQYCRKHLHTKKKKVSTTDQELQQVYYRASFLATRRHKHTSLF